MTPEARAYTAKRLSARFQQSAGFDVTRMPARDQTACPLARFPRFRARVRTRKQLATATAICPRDSGWRAARGNVGVLSAMLHARGCVNVMAAGAGRRCFESCRARRRVYTVHPPHAPSFPILLLITHDILIYSPRTVVFRPFACCDSPRRHLSSNDCVWSSACRLTHACTATASPRTSSLARAKT
jgi:hypothetical protein